MYLLDQNIVFPPVHLADDDGLLAVGGDLSIDRLLLGYRGGIFPWYSEGQPILWYSPDPRMVLVPEELKISKSMRQVMRRETFAITVNKAFDQVIRACAEVPRTDQEGTWITENMIIAYQQLHALGHAKSVEVWKDGILVGGLYGIDLPEFKVFCGESMFSHVSNASKIGFITWVHQLQQQNYNLIDCQTHTNHLESLGAKEIPRALFLEYLK